MLSGQLKTVQTTTLSQRQLLSARILAMDAVELNKYLAELAEENPVLDVDAMFAKPGNHELSWVGMRCRSSNNDDEDCSVWDTIGHGDDSLRFQLRLQLKEKQFSERDQKVLNYIIECINEDGYMTEDLNYIEDIFCLPAGYGETLLRVIQEMTPCGVGARNLSECISLQLRREHPEEKLAIKLAEFYLDELGNNRISYIAKKTGKSIEEVVNAYQVIRTVTPRPGSSIGEERSHIVVPDIIVSWEDGRFQVSTNTQSIPQIAVNQYYSQLAKSCCDLDTREYISEKYRQANWVASCIRQREITLSRIAGQLLNEQRSFFHLGPQFLRALTQKEIAESLELHESTVSRALRNKYLLCKWGVFPMKYFFSENVIAKGASGCGVHAILKELVEREDKRSPLTDQELAEHINALGVQISRRTIAKYRGELGIAASAQRKIY